MKTQDLKEGKLYWIEYKGNGQSVYKYFGIGKYWRSTYFQLFTESGRHFNIQNIKREATKEDIEQFKKTALKEFKEKLNKFCKI